MEAQPTLPSFEMLLVEAGYPLDRIVVMRHRPYEPSLNRIFDSIALEYPELFNCYQSTHAPRTEASLKKADFIASFIRGAPGEALFIGLYEIVSSRLLTAEEVKARPAHQQLMKLGMGGDYASRNTPTVTEFELVKSEWGAEWAHRLIIDWPGADRAWFQRADNGNRFTIRALARNPVTASSLPPWDEFIVDHKELSVLPIEWKNALRHWRGVYLITDRSDGMQYVGSAYGEENLLNRWLNYSVSQHGGNIRLKGRDCDNFQFSILELVAPTADARDVIAREASWKRRLRTSWPFGLNAN